MLQSFPNAELRLIGRGPLEKNLKKEVHNLKISNSVRFINNYSFPNPRAVVLEQMKESDIFILIGFQAEGDYGGTPIVLMEASSMGIPCITSSNAGNSEIIIENYIIIPENSIYSLKEAMLKLINDNNKREYFGINSRAFIKKNFNLKIQIKKLEDIYYSIKDL